MRAIGYGGVISDWKNLGSTVTLASVVKIVPYNTPVTIVLPTSYGNIILGIDPSSFQGVAQISMSRSYSFPTAPCPTMTLKPLGIGVDITVAPKIQPVKALSLVVPYRDTDIAGHIAANLLLAYYDSAQNIWVPVSSVANPAARTVSGQLVHLSKFQLMEAVASTASDAVKIFPNPFSPSKGHHYVQFTNLPAGTRIRIYTMLGELVRDLDAASGGTATWDGLNRFSNKVASGVYIVLLQGSGGDNVVKIAVER